MNAKIVQVGLAQCAALLACMIAWGGASAAQAPVGVGAAAPTARSMAPIDITGYWVSVITESWRFRMVTPAKGDYASIPITKAALEAADSWDPARDKANGELCKAYGGAALLNIPGRLHISWQDDFTLKVEMDSGQQTRLLHFAKGVPGAPSLQGYSVAEWVGMPRSGGERGGAAQKGPGMGTLKVITTNLLPGYLRKNGVPQSANAVVTEYWDLHAGPDGKLWVVPTVEVNDPVYLFEPYLTSPQFRQEPDGSKWRPEPCSID